MKKIIIAISAVFLLLLVFPKAGFAVNIDIGDIHISTDNEPPPIEITGQPELLPVPGRYVYFIPDTDEDIFYYHGQWYRPYKGRWFRSGSYDGRWIQIRDVPPALVDLPSDYRSSSSRFDRIQHGDLGKNWERWEKEKYWDRRRIEPPPFQITGQPRLFPIPGRYVYFVSDIDVEIFFYRGKWYRPYKNRWFISGSYNGPWDGIRDVPDSLQDLPRVFYRLSYGELRDNWEKWEREKYWDKRRDEDRERFPEERRRERY
jgi:hypothetical protein